ncbi:hypothetical protein T484DRAFT_1636281 [Baffinella frigidus]|nr:hypothetical protein T484DRAFT_1636281 [Cryptophyta sp. CCMP2293]
MVWASIAAHNEQARVRKFAGQLHACGICFEEVPGGRSVRLAGCKHVFCKGCMRGLCDVQISDGTLQMVRCPSFGCNQPLILPDVAQLVDRETFARFERLCLQRGLDQMDDLCWCPRCQGAVIKEHKDDTLAMCPTCFFNFCTLCRATW